ncbi:MAG TPA: glycogen synthase GlgA [Nitrospirota bacterium]|nr:glycogen synthase GlgA [Nitrospirota bacterium]
MRILFAASEAAPFAKTGGLADVAGSLPPALASLGHDVRVVMPRYQCVDPDRFKLKHIATFYVPLGSWKERGDILQGKMGGNVTVYFINKDIYYNRPHLYRTPHADYPDNAERFTFFSRSIFELCRAVGFSPDIIHAHDWQTGLVPFYLKKVYRDNALFRNTKTVFTVHNLGYQGLFWHWDLRLIGAGWDVFTPEGMEFWGKISFLKAGLVYSDLITTVSETYGKEIQTPKYGSGLNGVLAKRSVDLSGIMNGIDYGVWNPARDEFIAQRYSASRPAGKSACKEALRKRVGLPPSNAPLIGMVARLTEQKGLDILMEALPKIISLGAQIIIQGTGEERYHRSLTEAAGRYPNQMRVLLRFEEALARSIYAGSDLFLMPSRYEPCGLGQMIALRYGSVPLVRKTGGLADTVESYNSKTGQGTGFVFNEYSPLALIAALRRALAVYRNREKWTSLMRAGMKQDFSWARSAKEYVKLYRKALRKT